MTLDFTRTFKYPIGARIQMLMGACLSGLCAIYAAKSIGVLAALLFLGLPTLLFIVEFISKNYSVEITDDAISTHRLGIDKRLQWDEIGSIKSRDIWGDLQLQNSNNSISLRIDSQIEDYLEIIKLIEHKRPDLWKTNIPEKFHQGILGLLVLGGIGSFAAIMGIGGILQDELVTGIGLLAFGLVIWIYVLTQPRVVSLQEDNLVLKSVLHEQRLKARDINAIKMYTTSGKYRTVTHHEVTIRLTNGKKITLSGFKEGPPMMYHALQTWWQKNTNY